MLTVDCLFGSCSTDTLGTLLAAMGLAVGSAAGLAVESVVGLAERWAAVLGTVLGAVLEAVLDSAHSRLRCTQ